MSITSSGSGTGNGVVQLSVTANPNGSARTGTLTIAEIAVAVTEEGAACSVSISPDRASFTKDSADGSFAVSAPAGCQWSATSDAPWIIVRSGSPGSGDGTIGFSIETNRSTSPRTGAITVPDRTFTVTQAGDTGSCDYLVQPVDVSACMVAPSLSVSVTTQAGCTWTASASDSWITLLSGQSGVGSGTITFRLSDNYTDPRQGIVMVRWPTVTAGQNVRVSQAGCRYAVTTTSISFSADGGTGRFDVLQQSDPLECGGALQDRCVWTAVSDVPWITITSPMPRAGDNPVSFTVARNSGAERTGTITVRDKVVRITQAAR